MVNDGTFCQEERGLRRTRRRTSCGFCDTEHSSPRIFLFPTVSLRPSDSRQIKPEELFWIRIQADLGIWDADFPAGETFFIHPD